MATGVLLLFLMLAVTSSYGQTAVDLDAILSSLEIKLPEPVGTRGCPNGQIFCLKGGHCVDVVKEPETVSTSCPETPKCPDHQMVCNLNHKLECVDHGLCERVDVKFKVEQAYDSVVGESHVKANAFIKNLRQKMADKLSRPISEFWGVEIHPGENSVWIVFKSVLGAYAELDDIFLNQKIQFLVDQTGIDLVIDFESASVRIDCGMSQVCWMSGAPMCLPWGQCPVYKVFLSVEGDFDSVVGPVEGEFIDHFVTGLSVGVSVKSIAFEFVSIYPGDANSINIDFETSIPTIQADVQELINSGQFPTDFAGNLLTVTQFSVTLIDYDGSPDLNWDWTDWNHNENRDYCSAPDCKRCGPDEMLCLVTQECVKKKEKCTSSQCGTDEIRCWNEITGDRYCSAETLCITLSMSVSFLMEVDLANVDLGTFSSSLKITMAGYFPVTGDFISNIDVSISDPFLAVSFLISTSTPVELDSVLESIILLSEGSAALNIDGIDCWIVHSSLHFGTTSDGGPDLNWDWTDWNHNENRDYCSAPGCKRCGPDEMLCLVTQICVKKKEKCTAIQCGTSEIRCWNENTGDRYCSAETLCSTLSMSVSFLMEADLATVDLGTFSSSLKITMAGYFPVTGDFISNIDVSISDTFLAVNFLISTSTPVELDSVLESIILLSEGSTALHIDGIDCRIVHSSLHFGTTSDGGPDLNWDWTDWNHNENRDYCSAPDCKRCGPDEMLCLVTQECVKKKEKCTSIQCGTNEIRCWNEITGARYCSLETLCSTLSMSVSFLMEADLATVDLGTFSSSLKITMAGYFPVTGDFISNIDVSISDTFLAVNFLISASTPVELDSVLESIILLSEGSAALNIDGIDCWIVHSSLHFGTTSDGGPDLNWDWTDWNHNENRDYCPAPDCKRCGPDEMLCLVTQECVKKKEKCTSIQCGTNEIRCWNEITGDRYCSLETLCSTLSMSVSFLMEADLATVDLGTFSSSLKITMAGYFPVTGDFISNIDVSVSDTYLAVSFLISTSTPVELDSVLESIILLSEGSAALNIDGIDCWIVHSSLHFGTTSDGGPDLNWDWTDWNHNENRDYCSAPGCKQCGPDEMLCLVTHDCVKKKEKCTSIQCGTNEPGPRTNGPRCEEMNLRTYLTCQCYDAPTCSPRSFFMEADLATVDLGTFSSSLKTTLAGHFPVTGDFISYIDVSISDTGLLAVNFLISTSTPVELDSVLESIILLSEGSTALYIDGIECWIVPSSLHFGTTSGNLDGANICKRHPERCDPGADSHRDKCGSFITVVCQEKVRECGFTKPCKEEEICCNNACGTTCLPLIPSDAKCPDKNAVSSDCDDVCQGGQCSDGGLCCYSEKCRNDVCVTLNRTGDGACPAETSPVFNGICGSATYCGGGHECHQGEVCCYSDECGSQVCIPAQNTTDHGQWPDVTLPDIGSGSGDGCRDGENCQKCLPDKMYCLVTQVCVDKVRKCKDKGCTADQDVCWDSVAGTKDCVDLRTCKSTSMPAVFIIEGEFSTVTDLESYRLGLTASLMTLLQGTKGTVQIIEIKAVIPESILVKLLIEGPGPADLDAALNKLIPLGSGRVPLTVAGQEFQIREGSLHLGDCTDTDDHGNCVKCESPEIWCPDLQMCKPDCTPPEPDIFFMSIRPESGFDYFTLGSPATPTTPFIDTSTVRARLQKLEGTIQRQLEDHLSEMPNLNLDWIYAFPTPIGQDEKGVIIWVKILADKDSITVADLEDMLPGLTLTDVEGESMTFTTTVHAPPDEPSYIIIAPTELVAGKETKFDIREIIPERLRANLPETVRDSFPTQASLTCDDESKVFFIQEASGPAAEVQTITVDSSTGTIIRLVNRNEDIRRVSCDITFGELQTSGDPFNFRLGFLVVPEELSKLAQPKTVKLNLDLIPREEDSGCQSLPDDLFSIEIPGDSLLAQFYEWPSEMIKNVEIWMADDLALNLQTLLMDYVINRKRNLMSTRAAFVKISDDTQYTDDNKLVAKLKMFQGTVESLLPQGGGKTDLLATRANLKVCVKDNFNGDFNLEITPLVMDRDLEVLILPVQVTAVNDAPVVKEDIENILKNLDVAYPRVQVKDDDEVVPPEFSAAEIARQVCSDQTDRNDDLGVAFLGSWKKPNGVAGNWEYMTGSEPNGGWIPVPDFDADQILEKFKTRRKRSTGNEELLEHKVDFIALDGEAKLRFTPDESFKDVTWKRSRAPLIYFLCLDDTLDSSQDHTVMLHLCEAGTSEICGPGGTSAFSEGFIEFSLPRKGCDDVIDSGVEMLNEACDCGQEHCYDCMEVDGGDAKEDDCGICAAPGDMRPKEECCLPELRDEIDEKWRQICKQKEEDEKELEDRCPTEGEVPSLCGNCVPEGGDLKEQDLCGKPCGEDECLDCLDQPNGTAVVNLCGDCKPLESLNEGCDIGIGKLEPMSSYVWPTSYVSLAVTDSLASTPLADIQCVLNLLDGSSAVVPEVMLVEFENSQGNRIKLTLTVSETEADQSAGEFDILCLFGTYEVRISDNGEVYQRYSHPVMKNIDPEVASVDDDEQVTITADGLVNTGKVLCVAPCPYFNRYCSFARNDVAYFYKYGDLIDDRTVRCDLDELQRFGKGMIFYISVILEDLWLVDMNRLPSPLPFTVKMPAPNLLSAVMDKKGCAIISIEFDRYITATASTGSSCAQFFTVIGSSADLSGAQCSVLGTKIVMVFDDGVAMPAVGTELSIHDYVVYDPRAVDDVVSYASGTVTVESLEMVHPVLTIDGPAEIGAQIEYLKIVPKNRGCHEFSFDWAVQALDAAPGNTEVTDKLVALNSRLSSLTNKRGYSLQADEFVSEVTYEFALTWSSIQHPSISGTATHTLTRDDSKLIQVKIRGVKDTHNPIDPLKIFAEVVIDKSLQTPGVKSYYEWTVLPPVSVTLRNKPSLWFPGNTFKAQVEYVLKFTASVGSFSQETKVKFLTLSNPLIARINGNDEPEITIPADNDLMLSAAESIDPDHSEENDQFTWRCKTNLGSPDPDTFQVCTESENNKPVPVEKYGPTIQLLAAERILRKPDDNGIATLRQKWTLEWRKGNRHANASKIINYKEVISVPKIKLRTEKVITVGPGSEVIRIKARCKAKTKHAWRSAEDFPAFDLDAAAKDKKQIEKTYGPNSDPDRFKRCDLLLDFTKEKASKQINGQTYKLILKAYSEHMSGIVDTSESVIIKTFVRPISGTVNVLPLNPDVSLYKAWETKFQMQLYGWRDSNGDADDDANLYCRYYKKKSGSDFENINTPYEPIDKQLTFTLPQGTFTFKAKCCNKQRLCSSKDSEDTITVEPVNMAEEESSGAVLTQAIAELHTVAVFNAFSVMRNLIRFAVAIASTASPTYVGSLKVTIKVEINVVIQNMLPDEDSDSDLEDTVGTLEDSTQLLKEHNNPQEIDMTTKLRMMRSARASCSRFTGRTGRIFGRLKKREVIEYSEGASGLTESQAESMLDVFIATLGTNSTYIEEIMTKEIAEEFFTVALDVMVGMCQAYNEDGSSPWNAMSELITVQLAKHNLTGSASAFTDIVSSDFTTPAMIMYGADIETRYGGFWECANDTDPCPNVCLATAQIGPDIFTKTATLERDAPIRHSDFIVTKLINPEKIIEETIKNLVNPIIVKVQTDVSDLTDFDLLCMMWIEEEWKDLPCTTGIPTLQGSSYTVDCSCKELGILGVFQTEKSNTTVTTTTSSTTTRIAPKQLSNNAKFVLIRFKVQGDLDVQLARFERTVFVDHLKQKMADLTGASVDSFLNFRVEKGSIAIIFDLYPSSTPGSDSLGQMVAVIENMVQTGTLVLTNPDGDTLAVMTDSFNYEEQTDGDDEKKTTDPLPYILGGVLGGLAIIGLFTVISIIAIKKTRGNRTRPNSPQVPAPGFGSDKTLPAYHSPSPPPYSAFATPRKDALYPPVQKWTINELKVAEPPEERRAPRLTGSGSSLERRRILTMEEERQPTPVDN